MYNLLQLYKMLLIVCNDNGKMDNGETGVDCGIEGCQDCGMLYIYVRYLIVSKLKGKCYLHDLLITMKFPIAGQSCPCYENPNSPVCENGGSCYCDKGSEEAGCYCVGGYRGTFCEIPPGRQ